MQNRTSEWVMSLSATAEEQEEYGTQEEGIEYVGRNPVERGYIAFRWQGAYVVLIDESGVMHLLYAVPVPPSPFLYVNGIGLS